MRRATPIFSAGATRRSLWRGRLGRVAATASLLAVVGGVAVATGAVPDSGDGEVHVCYRAPDSRERTGAEMRVVDAERVAGEKNCRAQDRELKINQEGPQGVQGEPGTNGTNGTDGTDGTNGAPGAQGAQGASGTSTAFTATGSASVVNNDVVVVSKTVPAGSYAVNASAFISNVDDDDRAFGNCSLRASGAVVGTISNFSLEERSVPGDREDTPLLATLSNYGGGPLEVRCSEIFDSDRVDVQAALTAIKVDSVQ